MYERITVNQAIKRGHWMLTYPAFVIIGLSLILVFYLRYVQVLPSLGFKVSIFGAFFLAFIYRCFVVTRWKIWAFNSVANVHELHERAVREMLMYKEGSFLAKFELKTSDNKSEWARLQTKFEQPDIYYENYEVPEETLIYFSKKRSLINVIIGVILVGTGLYVLFKAHSKYIGGFVTFMGGVNMIKNLSRLFNNYPQMIISNEGLEAGEADFYGWEHIRNEDISKQGVAHKATVFFTYDHALGSEKVDLSELAISVSELDKLLRTYRKRYERNIGF